MQDRFSGSLDEVSRTSTASVGIHKTPQQIPQETRKSVRQSGHSILWKSLFSILCFWCVAACVTTKAANQVNVPTDNVLLDFTAKWCGPCQQMSPIISRLERQGFPIRKVDIDVEKGLASQYKIDSIPCFVLVANGREINRITGATDERELRQLLMLLPKQNIDDAMLGKSTPNKGNVIPASNSGTKSPDDKKPFLKMPQIFAKNQDKNQDLVLVPTDVPDTVRGQNPSQDNVTDGFARDPLFASTRIRVKDGTKLHFGSGTIIDSRPGRSVILTCGHIFRDLGKDATVEVDLFSGSNSKPQTLIAQIVCKDLKSDLGIITIPSKQPLPAIRLGAVQDAVSVRDRVVSVGCGGGEKPTREELVVTAINKYVGPDNVECSGVPQQGRSGGGLFLGSELVGVCIAADPRDKRGIYTAMKPVAQLLEKAQFGYLAPTLVSTEDTIADAGSQKSGSSLGNPQELIDDSPRGSNQNVAGVLDSAMRDSGTSTTNPGDYLDAEIVCIVRPKKAGALSRVVIVNQASRRFVDDLLHESGGGVRSSESALSAQSQPVKKSIEKRTAPASTSSGTRMAMQRSLADDDDEFNRPIETSFELQRDRRKRN